MPQGKREKTNIRLDHTQIKVGNHLQLLFCESSLLDIPPLAQGRGRGLRKKYRKKESY